MVRERRAIRVNVNVKITNAKEYEEKIKQLKALVKEINEFEFKTEHDTKIEIKIV